jgi:PAS domain S-box-containing protein
MGMSADIRDRILDSLMDGDEGEIRFFLDRHYRYLLFNERHRAEMRKVWDAEIEEGVSILDCMPDAVLREAAKASFDRVLGGEGFAEVQEQTGNGTSYRFLWRPVVGSGGEVLAISASVFDISDVRATEKRLKDSESRYRRLHESMTEAFAQVDMAGRLVEFNEAYRSLVGYSKEELLSLSYTDLTPDRWHAMESMIVEEQILPRGYSEVYEKEYRRKDGSLVPVELRTFLLRDGEDLACGMWAIVRDISERKRAERQLNDANDTLERRVRERTRQYETANKELEAFAYSVSHDLRAPLRAISGFSTILADEFGPSLDIEGRRLISVVVENSQKMDRLITVILELSRMGRVELQASRVDMAAMARSMFFEVATPEERAAVSLTIEALPEAEGDAPMLRLVWAKLLSNAVKFTGRSALREILVDSAKDEEGQVYRVSDTGAGFDMAYSGKLFNVFQRLHSEDDFKGSGVGLAIVKRIVERHGGRVGASGQVGKGSTFWFSLPPRSPAVYGGPA